MGKILNKNRIKSLNFFRTKMKKAVQEMIKHESNSALKTAYEKVLINLENVPINFYPKNSLMRTVFKIGEHFIASEILGEHKQNLKIIKKNGKVVGVVPEGRLIEIPAGHFFHGDKASWKGVHTLMHELCHNPSRNVFEFSKEIHLNPTQTEELIADLLSARIAIKMGFPRKRIYELYKGRQSVYGRFPFRKALEKAVSPKKEPKKTEIISVKKLREKREREKRKRIERLKKQRMPLRRRAA